MRCKPPRWSSNHFDSTNAGKNCPDELFVKGRFLFFAPHHSQRAIAAPMFCCGAGQRLSSPHCRVHGIVDAPRALGKRTGRLRGEDVYALFDAAIRQQLQGRGWRSRSLRSTIVSIEVDILRGESRTPEFLAKNPSGQVPLLEVAPDRFIAESNAILWYVAGGTTLAPDDRIDRAETLQWMFFEQHSLEPNLGAAYFWLALVKGGRELQQHALEDWMEHGYRSLGIMEDHLRQARLLRGRALYHRRHRALRLHAPGASVRLQPDAVSCGPRLARPRRERARIRGHADAGADRGGRRIGPRSGAFCAPDLARPGLRLRPQPWRWLLHRFQRRRPA